MFRTCAAAARLIAALGLICLAGISASAQITVFSDRASFDLACPGMLVEDFEEARVAPGNIVSMPNALDSSTNNAIFLTGEILDGLQIATSGPNAASDATLAIPGQGFSGVVPSKSVFDNYLADSLNLLFANGGVAAVGVDLLSWQSAAAQTISVYGANGLLDTVQIASVATSGTFLGLCSAGDLITSINIAGSGSYTRGVDNVAFGSPSPSPEVPEPSSLALLAGCGIAGAIVARRRR